MVRFYQVGNFRFSVLLKIRKFGRIIGFLPIAKQVKRVDRNLCNWIVTRLKM